MAEKPEDNNALHNWAIALEEEGRERRKAHEGVWWQNIATYTGDFWVDWDPHKTRLWEPVPKPDHKVRLPINLAQPVIRTELAKLTKNRPILNVIPNSDDRSDLNAAEVGDKMLGTYAERQFSMPKVRRRMLHWVLTTGLGGIFVDYDEAAEAPIEVWLNPEGEPIFDEQTIDAYKKYYKKKKQSPKKDHIPQGELRIRPLSPFQILWDASTNYIEDAWWCIVTEVYDVEDIRRRWDVKVEPEKDAIPAVMEKRLLNKFDLSHKLSVDDIKVQELAKVHRLFIKPGHRFFPNGLELVFTDDKIIEKNGYPYAHEELPVTVMGHIPLPVSQFPMSVLQQIHSVVLELSKTESQLIENRNLMANVPWRIARQHKIDQEFINKPGLRLTYTHVPNIPAPEPIQMPEMPVYVQNLVPLLREHVLEISGQGETSQGRIPEGARSGVAIAYLQEEDDTRLGPTVSEFEEAMERVGGQMLSHMAQFYTTPRTVRLYRKHGEPEVFDFVGTQITGNTGVQCQAGSAMPRSKAARQAFILDLWDRKIEQDPRRVREMLELTSGEPDEWDIDFSQAERENRKMQQGHEAPVEEWHNHLAHHYKHRNFMKTADFEAMDEAKRELFMAHDAEHTRFEQLAQQSQMEMAQLGGGAGLSQNGGGQEMYSPPTAGTSPNGANNPEGPQGAFALPNGPQALLNYQPQ